MKVLFCNIGWMKNYKYLTREEAMYFGHCHFIENMTLEETTNFLLINDKCYGYVDIDEVDVNRIDDEKNQEKKETIENVLVVWASKDPDDDYKDYSIVGWYRDATVYRYPKSNLHINKFQVEVDAKNVTLLPIKERMYILPSALKTGIGRGFGELNVWYGDRDESRKIIENAVSYINSYNGENLNKYLSFEEIQETIEDYKDEYDISDINTWIEKGIELYNKEEYKKAIKYFNKCIVESDDYKYSMYLKGLCAFYTGRQDYAIELFKICAKLYEKVNMTPCDMQVLSEIYYMLNEDSNLKEKERKTKGRCSYLNEKHIKEKLFNSALF